ncbi:hypothetical protein P9112_012993 [Eukaryota sp. TZLM1-RC]
MKKKGTSGTAVSYITRTMAIKRLQVTLKDFRRLCILKGIFPRTPKRKVHGSNKTYYLTKDIKYLQHEPLLQKFREMKSFLKRHSKALNRRDTGLATNLRLQKPQITLDHIIKERYPTFERALFELDDALSMIYLFASLPSDQGITPERVSNCKSLVSKWEDYIVKSKSLNAAFLSIKGVYCRALISGQSVIWRIPYPFPQDLPKNIDYKVMDTFVQFYEVLLAFVLFKLVNDLNSEEEAEEDVEFKTQNEGFSLSNEVVFLGREVPRDIFKLLILACQGRVGWDGVDSPFGSDDPSITLEICDRPKPLNQTVGREYVQPQWIVDCLNFNTRLSMLKYRPGVELPSHLSPFVEYNEDDYKPRRYSEILQEKSGSVDQSDNQSDNQLENQSDVDDVMDDGDDDSDDDSDDEEEVGVGVKRRVSESEVNRAKIMMPKKKRKMYEAMQKGSKEKEEEIERLKKRARQLRKKKRV